MPRRSHLPLSNRLKAQIKAVAKLHTKVENTRRDQLRKVARRIERCYRLVAIEEHSVQFMKRNRRTSRTVSDVAPGLFKSVLKHALGAHRYVPVGTVREGIGGNSQTCLCGESVPKPLEQRWHDCPACGLSADRDTVSANIVMGVAFGYANLGEVKLPAPGQGVVRRGEGKSRGITPSSASARAAEPPAKRPSSSGRPLLRNTTDACGLPPKPRTRRSSTAGASPPSLRG
jgi:hypothetical protein